MKSTKDAAGPGKWLILCFYPTPRFSAVRPNRSTATSRGSIPRAADPRDRRRSTPQHGLPRHFLAGDKGHDRIEAAIERVLTEAGEPTGAQP